MAICVQSCSHGNFRASDFDGTGTYAVERILQAFPAYVGRQGCRYIKGVTDCEAFFQPATECLYAQFGKTELVDSLIANNHPSLAISNLIAFQTGSRIQDYFASEDSSFGDLRLVSFHPDEPPIVRKPESEFPGRFVEDSIKFYGNCYFGGLENWSFLLKEKWVMKGGKSISKEIEAIEIGLNSKESNRFHAFGKLEFNDLPRFLAIPANRGFWFTNLAFPDTLMTEEFPFQSFSLKSAYDADMLFLLPHRIDGQWVPEREALSLLTKNPAFTPRVPPAEGLNGEIWLLTRFFDPEYAFQIPANRFEATIDGGSLNLEKQLNGILGAFTDGKSFRQNLVLSYKAKATLLDELRMKLQAGGLNLYDPDSLLLHQPRRFDLEAFDAKVKSIWPYVPVNYELEFFMNVHLRKGKQEKELSYLRLVFNDPFRNSPERNFMVVNCRDIQDIFARVIPGTDISLGRFFQDYAFYEIYNLNGRGTRTHQDAKDYLDFFYSLQPQPVGHE